MGECDTNGQATATYVIQNNTGTDLRYKIQYKIQGETGFTTHTADLLVSANSSASPFTQSVPSGKYIEWRYAVSDDQNTLATAPAQAALQLSLIHI